MLREHYSIRLVPFLIFFMAWSAWMIGWLWAPVEELVWYPLKWIFITVFTPIGVILVGALTGYRIELRGSELWFGFFPFIRKIQVMDIEQVKKGGTYPLSLWKTDDFLTIVIKTGEAVSMPCNNVKAIISRIKPCTTNGTP